MTTRIDRTSWFVGSLVLLLAACVDDANVVGSSVGDAGASGSTGTTSTGSGGRADAAGAGAANTSTESSAGRASTTEPSGGTGGSQEEQGGVGAAPSGEGGSDGSTGGSKTGGSPASGGSQTGGRESGGTGGVKTGGSGGAGGGTGGVPTGGSAGTGGSTYDPCAGKACGDSCSPCDPDDASCDLPMATCDGNGDCLDRSNALCPSVWAETNASQYALDETGTTTLHNETNETVYLPGCEHYYYEQKVAAEWTDRGPELVLCTWEGTARPVPARTDAVADIGPFTTLGAGTWRIRFTVGHGCSEDKHLSEDDCTSLEEVYTPAFLVQPSETCGDADLMAAYADCATATDADTCAERGGTWAPFGLGSTPICQCETGDGDCPCTSDSDCVTVCLAPNQPAVPNPCTDVTEGTCAAHPTAGCWCLVDAGEATQICWD